MRFKDRNIDGTIKGAIQTSKVKIRKKNGVDQKTFIKK